MCVCVCVTEGDGEGEGLGSSSIGRWIWERARFLKTAWGNDHASRCAGGVLVGVFAAGPVTVTLQ